MSNYKTQVLIIGGGATGTGIVRDLALRGVDCILVEQQDLNAGASGANHGLLHSGGRYVFTDPGSATECREEAVLLKQLAAHCIEDTGGMFVAVEGDDENYASQFPQLCEKCGIPVKTIDVKEARAMEPVLSDKLVAAYLVEDASIDPFMLCLDNMAQAQMLGSRLLCFSKVIGFEKRDKKILATRLLNTLTGQEFLVEADQVVNASGAWAGIVAGLAGATIHILYSQGSLLIAHNRITNRVINRLRPSSNADILVPGGTVSILGTTSVSIDHPDHAAPTVAEVDTMIEGATAMIPALEKMRYIRAYAGVRPLVTGKGDVDGRTVSRGFVLLDHVDEELENFVTISGGKLTTYRYMAEKTADLVCRKMNIKASCKTRTEPLPATQSGRWTEPGLAPKRWLKQHDPEDLLLCECEMVPKSVVDAIVDGILEQNGQPDLNAVSLRSRIGKGPCQGTFCGPRTLSYLYDKGNIQKEDCLDGLKKFLNQRWKGQYPTLWDRQLAQAELLEAMHCGLFGLEL